jgi:radical SAM superfamily enzyme YgiQ (UPF0313 family)
MSVQHTEKTNIDMLLLSVPWWDMFVVPCGPSILKGISESHGFNLKILDCNDILKYKFCNGNQKDYFELENYFCYATSSTPELVNDYYNYIVDQVVDLIKTSNVRFIGLSVFSIYTQKATLELVKVLKDKTTVPIVVGGRGLSTKTCISIHNELSISEKLINFSDILRKRKLVDHVIEGDGEDAIIDLFTGTLDNISDSSKFIAKRKTLDYPFSNFDDYNFDHYKHLGTMQLPVISSKGCVRSCDFCDVAAQMAKFQSKDGNRLADEMIYLSQKYNVTEFASADSIGNGNLKELKKTVSRLIEYNQSVTADKQVQWTANWICRPRNSIKPDFFDLLKQSGCKHLTIGAEHGSDRVLTSMNKKTNVDGFFYEIKQLDRVGIQFSYNNVMSHWSEEFEDFLELIKMWVLTGKYVAKRSVSVLNLSLFSALDNTPATNVTNLNQLVKADDNFTLLWYSKKNPTLTLKTKLLRFLIMIELSLQLNLPIQHIVSRLKTINDYINNNEQISKYNQFFEKEIEPGTDIECKNTLNLSLNVKDYIDSLLEKLYPTSSMTLVFDAESVNGLPCLQVEHNNVIVYEQDFVDGSHTVSLTLPTDFDNTNNLKFKLTNKGQYDTLVDEQGNIVKDKCIKFKKILLDEIDLLTNNVEFYYRNNSGPGLFSSLQHIELSYDGPFWAHFLKNTPNYANWNEKNDPNEVQILINQLKQKINLLKY